MWQCDLSFRKGLYLPPVYLCQVPQEKIKYMDERKWVYSCEYTKQRVDFFALLLFVNLYFSI